MPGFETYFTSATPATVAKGVMASNKDLKWMDSSRRGYMLVELTPERTTSEWRFVETVKQRTPRLGGMHRMTAKHGARKLGS